MDCYHPHVPVDVHWTLQVWHESFGDTQVDCCSLQCAVLSGLSVKQDRNFGLQISRFNSLLTLFVVSRSMESCLRSTSVTSIWPFFTAYISGVQFSYRKEQIGIDGDNN